MKSKVPTVRIAEKTKTTRELLQAFLQHADTNALPKNKKNQEGRKCLCGLI